MTIDRTRKKVVLPNTFLELSVQLSFSVSGGPWVA